MTDTTKYPLSERLREGIEAAPWVINAVLKLEAELVALKAALKAGQGEPVAWETDHGNGLKRYLTHGQYRKTALKFLKFYRPITHAPTIPEGMALVNVAAIEEIIDAYVPHSVEAAYREALSAAPQPNDNGPDFEDGCSLDGFIGGCERMGCHQAPTCFSAGDMADQAAKAFREGCATAITERQAEQFAEA